ncbi:MAG TPA: class II aldolase/adducin family protein [Chloroflexota bacterium]|nr:class II aldolase/adducin family protein [Chloroflexota bacterium]
MAADTTREDPAGVETAIAGEAPGPLASWFLAGLTRAMAERGYHFPAPAPDHARLVLNVVKTPRPRPFRRRSKATYVVVVAEADEPPADVLKSGYPLLIRALGNLLIYLIGSPKHPKICFITLERGCYEIPPGESESALFDRVVDELAPLASSRLVIDNEIIADLPESVRLGDPIPNQIRAAGARLDRLGLLPSPFPLDELLSPADIRHIHRLYGIGGLSYGNVSARARLVEGFWMTATGVDKGNLGEAGRDILLVSGYDLDRSRILVRAAPHPRPRHVSVDAIEHALIYEEHPGVAAIVHVHSWMPEVPATRINFPCGTYELGLAVADVLRRSPDPNRAIVGLKNHGLTMTGPSLDDIFDRIDGKLLPSVPAM